MSVVSDFAGDAVDQQPQAVTWPVFESKLVGRQLVATNTMSFSFSKPADWTFRAGQFVDITLLHPPMTDAEGDTRGFSISSAPSEGVITITTRLRDTAFKRSLQQVALGTPVRIEGPFGELAFEDPTRPAVVLTGGIGITPFHSMLVEAARHGGLDHPVVVVHSNGRPEEAPFLAELQQLAERDDNLVFGPTMTDLGPSDAWAGERSRIDVALLRRHLDGVSNAIYFLAGPPEPIYYLTGPPGLVRALRTMLDDIGIDPHDIRTEEFTGY
jgi:ferredoxin-NADP reductase